MRLLIIHPDETILEDLSAAFLYDGYEVFRAASLKRAKEILLQQEVDLTLLTDETEEENILDFYSVLESSHAFPAMLMTRSPSVKHIVLLLEYGYQEVVRYPMDMLEIKARVRALLRQKPMAVSTCENQFMMELFGLQIDLIHRILSRDGKSVQLTSKEFEVLLVLIREKGEVLTRADLARDLWSETDEVHERNIDVYVRRLREKLSTLGMDELVATKWGEGYLLRSTDPLRWKARELTHAYGVQGKVDRK